MWECEEKNSKLLMAEDKKNYSPRRAALAAAFPRTTPVMAGYVFLGISYGIYMNVEGFAFWYPALMAIVIYGGSLEFVVVTMLLSPFAPVTSFVMALMIQLRHTFYGISMLEKYRDMGWKKFFLIFGLSDETFSIAYSAEIPKGIDRGWYYLWTTWLDESYWIIGATIGGLVGSHLPFNTEGIEFVETALFTVIFVDQWLKEKTHWTALIGLGVSVLCLVLFGEDSFMVPTLVGILMLVTLFRKSISTGYDLEENTGKAVSKTDGMEDSASKGMEANQKARNQEIQNQGIHNRGKLIQEKRRIQAKEEQR